MTKHQDCWVPDAEFEFRFWPRVESSTDGEICWPWIGGTNGRYGVAHRPRRLGHPRTLYAHRAAWMIHNGLAIPADMVVRHKCDNPICCNPAHLEIGTDVDNARDAKERGRAAVHERHGGAKLTKESVAAIRRRMADGESRKAIARSLGVTASTIDDIAWGKTWV